MTLSNVINVHGRIAPKEADNRTALKINSITGIGYAKEESPKTGYFKKVSGVTLLKNNLSQLLRTEKGERFMLPNYGCGLRRYLMEQMDDTLFNEVKTQIVKSIARYLGNITVKRLQVFETDSNEMNVKLFCGIKDEVAVTFDTTLSI